MAVNKRKKNSRQHGTHTHGWGAKKKHRGAGNRGGRGNAGTGKRSDTKKPSIWKIKKAKGKASRFGLGKHGFKLKNAIEVNAVNLLYLDNHIDTLVKEKKAEFKAGAYTIDLKKLGYNKLLSKGTTSKKLNIMIEQATEQATKKVEKAGGKINIIEKKKPKTETKPKTEARIASKRATSEGTPKEAPSQ